MPEIYAKQKKFFRKAYETGEHGWPEIGPTPHVAKLVKSLGNGRGRTALDLKFADASFDLVLDYGCFHHVVTRDWPRYRREIARVLKPGGHLLLSVFSMKFKHHPDERRTRNWLVHRNHYDHFFTPAEIRGAFAPVFSVRTQLEELECLNGFWHVLLRKH